MGSFKGGSKQHAVSFWTSLSAIVSAVVPNTLEVQVEVQIRTEQWTNAAEATVCKSIAIVAYTRPSYIAFKQSI